MYYQSFLTTVTVNLLTATTLSVAVLSLTACSTNAASKPANAVKIHVSPTNEAANSQTKRMDNAVDIRFNACQSQFFQQTQPIITEKLAKNSFPLCFDGFAVMYSGVSKTPIWVAENLTKQRLLAAKSLVRVDNFHEESRLPKDSRSLLSDYTRTGYDRGHLAPNADMPDTTSQFDSFSLANIAPQQPDNNRKTWAKIETQTRNLTNKYGTSYVVTGVAFLTPEVKQLNNRVLVPSHFFKAIYLPTQNQSVAVISPNDNTDTVQTISLADLKKRTGVDAFPNLPANVQPLTLK